MTRALATVSAFAKALEDAGVLSDINSITRVVIDLNPSASAWPVLHIQRIGDERLIDLAALLAGEETAPEVPRAADAGDA